MRKIKSNLIVCLVSVFVGGLTGCNCSKKTIDAEKESIASVEESSFLEESLFETSEKPHAGPTTYQVLADGTINFGSYPQSKVTDSTLKNMLNSAAGTLPTASNSQQWTSYDYYINDSNETDYMWYQDVQYSGSWYRGIYFISYKPHSYQENNGYSTGNVYWFLWETLNWVVLEEGSGTSFLLCNSIIDSQEYYHDDAASDANNYSKSNIRKWLNETFYETAFTELQQGLIQITVVDNSAKSTNLYGQPLYWNNGVNDYACENTNDKIFLLSKEEATNPNYGFGSDSARCRKSSAYAKCQGCYTYPSTGIWWLRSPYYDNCYMVWGIGYGGRVGREGRDNVNSTDRGVVPALKLTL